MVASGMLLWGVIFSGVIFGLFRRYLHVTCVPCSEKVLFTRLNGIWKARRWAACQGVRLISQMRERTPYRTSFSAYTQKEFLSQELLLRSRSPSNFFHLPITVSGTSERSACYPVCQIIILHNSLTVVTSAGGGISCPQSPLKFKHEFNLKIRCLKRIQRSLIFV